MVRLKSEILIFIASTLKYNPGFKSELVQYDFAVIKPTMTMITLV